MRDFEQMKQDHARLWRDMEREQRQIDWFLKATCGLSIVGGVLVLALLALAVYALARAVGLA